MAKKKTSSARKTTQSKARTGAKSASSSRQGISAKLSDASDAVTGAYNGIPASAFYWGLGALALGAAAVGAYMYRDRIMEVYEETMESFNLEGGADVETESSEDEETVEPVQTRKGKNSSTQSPVDYN